MIRRLVVLAFRVSLVLIACILGVRLAEAGGETCSLDTATSDGSAEWAVTDSRVAVLGVATPAAAVEMTLELRVVFGPLEYTWVEGPFEIVGETSDSASVTIPAAAFLHDVATDYVADLIARIQFKDSHGMKLQEVAVPNAYVAWPDGRDAGGVIWSKADLATHAPDGRLDEHVVDSALAGYIVRYLPPIGGEVNKAPVGFQEDEDYTHKTVPVDHQADEE